MIAPARRAAHHVLRAVHTGRSDLASALEQARRSLADPRDRALTGEIAIGVLRRRAALDHVLAQIASRPLTAITPAVLDLLRAAAYQVIHLDRVPPHAAVDDAVALARGRGPPAGDRLRQRGAAGAGRSPASDRATGSPPDLRRRPERREPARRARLPERHPVASALARRALAGPPRLAGGRRVGAIQQPAGAGHAATEPEPHHRRRSARRPRRGRRPHDADATRPARARGHGGRRIVDPARRRRTLPGAGRGLAARPRVGRSAGRRPCPRPLRGPRRKDGRPRTVGRRHRAGRRHRPQAAPRGAPGANARPAPARGACPSSGWTPLPRCRSARSSTGCWSTPPARASAPSAATRTSAGAAPRTTFPRSPPANSTCSDAQRRPFARAAA